MTMPKVIDAQKLVLPIGAVVASLLFVGTWSWRMARFCDSIHAELREIRHEVQTLQGAQGSAWSVRDQRDWSARLLHENTTLPMSVPDPVDVVRDRAP